MFQFRTSRTNNGHAGYAPRRPAVLLTSPAKRRTKVLMVGMDLHRTRGGITTLTKDILASSVGEEFDIEYIASQAEDLGVARKALMAAQAFAFFSWQCVFDKPDFVYINVGSNASLYRESSFFLLAKLLGIRSLGHFHAGDIEVYLPRQPNIGKAFITAALKACDSWIAVSEASLASLGSITDAQEITLIRNGINSSDFHHLDDSKNESPAKLLFVGAAGKLKGERDLVNALSLVKQRGLSFRVAFAGYGVDQLRNRLGELGLSDLVDHLGPVATNERIGHFQNADIFVLPTYAEALPISVIEAMACGVSIITTPVGGIPEIIEDGKHGLFIAPGDVNGLADKICLLIENEPLRKSLGANARDRARNELDFREYETRLARKLREFAGNARGAGTTARLAAKRAIKSSAALVKSSLRRNQSAGSVCIMAYHRVVADVSRAEKDAYYGLVISTATFRRHCELLAATCEVLSLDDAVAALQCGNLQNRRIAVITFDDGYRDNYDEAFPVLRELGLPATVFVPTALIGQDQPLAHDRIFWLLTIAQKRQASLESALIRAGFSRSFASKFRQVKNSLVLTDKLVYLPYLLRERVIGEIEQELEGVPPNPSEHGLLTWEMVREMASCGISFGSHTTNHAVLPLEDRTTAEDEIILSKRILEEEVGIAATTFAYPNGAFSDNIRKTVKAAGYQAAVTTARKTNGVGSDVLALGRISLCEESTRGISGGYSGAVAKMRLGV